MRSMVRGALKRAGYVLWKRDFLRFGYDPWLDVARLSKATDWPIQTVFDVGANDGQTLAELRGAFPAARVHCFEPHPKTFARLKGKASGSANLHELALSDRCGCFTFYEYGSEGDGSLMNSLSPNAGFAVREKYPAKELSVSGSTIDAFCEAEGIERIDLMKIDVEGHDLAVIRGAKQMLTENRVGFILAEFNDLLDRPGVHGGSMMPMAEILAPFGLRYVATYTDRVDTNGPLWVSANVLFAPQSI